MWRPFLESSSDSGVDSDGVNRTRDDVSNPLTLDKAMAAAYVEIESLTLALGCQARRGLHEEFRVR